jgi:hypothetical protein
VLGASLLESDLQIVVLHNVFQQIDNPSVGEVFLKLLQLKKNGYATRHSRRFIPVGTHDFFGVHLLVCEKKTMEPILCSKIVSYKNCSYYNVPFPLDGLDEVFNNHQQLELQKIIFQRITQGRDVSYSGGLTINPKFKGFGLSSLFKDIYTGIHYRIHEHHGYKTMMGFSTPKVGTDVFFKTWGVNPLVVNGSEMKPTALPFANGAESILVWGDLENLSDYKKEMAKKYNDLWDNRLEYLMDMVGSEAA